jgi:hypothetical protein
VRQAIDQAVLATAAIRGRSVRPARARHVRDAPLRSPRVAGVSDPRECACGAAKPRSFSPNASQATGERAKRAEGASTRHARR